MIERISFAVCLFVCYKRLLFAELADGRGVCVRGVGHHGGRSKENLRRFQHQLPVASSEWVGVRIRPTILCPCSSALSAMELGKLTHRELVQFRAGDELRRNSYEDGNQSSTTYHTRARRPLGKPTTGENDKQRDIFLGSSFPTPT